MPTSSAGVNQPFDRNLHRLRRDRAARRARTNQLDDFLYQTMADAAVDRLFDLKRRFETVLVIDARDGYLLEQLPPGTGSEQLVCTDLGDGYVELLTGKGFNARQLDCEQLPFPPSSFDLIIACGGLHWVNDLPGFLAQVRDCLTPDGLFLGAMIGGYSLSGLGQSLMETELTLRDGASPRLSPRMELMDAAALLQRAGFALPVADRERLVVDYRTPMKLLEDLRAMGETNALVQQARSTPPRALFPLALASMLGEDEKLTVPFEILFLAGWRPDASKQQQPLAPGSGETSLADILKPEI